MLSVTRITKILSKEKGKFKSSKEDLLEILDELEIKPRNERYDNVLINLLEKEFLKDRVPQALLKLYLKLREYDKAADLFAVHYKNDNNIAYISDIGSIVRDLPADATIFSDKILSMFETILKNLQDLDYDGWFHKKISIPNANARIIFYLKVGQYDESLKVLEYIYDDANAQFYAYMRLKNENKNIAPKIEILRALQCEEQNDLDSALKIYEKVTRDFPVCWDAHLAYAEALYMKDKNNYHLALQKVYEVAAAVNSFSKDKPSQQQIAYAQELLEKIEIPLEQTKQNEEVSTLISRCGL